MKLQVTLDAFPYLLEAAGTTLWISLLGIALGQVIGAAVCLCRVSPLRPLARFGAVYVSFFRGVPLLVQLLLVYYFLPYVGIDVPPLVAAIGSLGLASGAYVCEIFRGALTAVPKGQAEAAQSLGFPPAAIWRRILLPQMLRISLPALVNELILLLKASSLISVVGVTELTRSSHTFAASTYHPLEIYLTAAFIYLLMNLCLAAAGAMAERRLAAG
ncbi:amino acid ABC transporter permease [Limobrevibacterium gyesilva]|uniref:Amino acid ABC transporter permease n=1 Tax=Limobrevibacterium gyesilva TaxID=2991712 RepID=A0AA41YKA6_9PROT|nr:amino acid ABC transporter permease [Limobrevibacterium gyesilva]MCW3475311.1 amino acid ABC transporter permease [Limobrevibacterium gyesilva]